MTFRVFGKNTQPDEEGYCSYCDKAKKLLSQFGYEYEYVNVLEDELALTMLKENGFRTVPQIYKGEKHIGGYTELFQYITTENEGV